MTENSKSAVYRACRMVLRPLASILLRCGLTWKEFSDLSKSVFVEAATADFGLRGRPTNVSRVSIITGISRKEVKRQRDLLGANEPPVRGKTTDATRVLSGWFQDEEFQDNKAQPMLLSESGPSPSFEALCQRYSGDIAVQTMLKELLQTETIERTSSGELRVKRRFYQPAVHDDEALSWAMSFMKDLGNTLITGVFPEKKKTRRFMRMADNVRMKSSNVAAFRKFLDRQGQTFLEEIDEWLTKNEAKNTADSSELIRLGVGLFAIEDESRKE